MGYSTRPPQNSWEEIKMGKFSASNIHKLLTAPKTKTEKLSVTARTYIRQVASEIITGCVRTLDLHSLDWGIANEPYAAEKIAANNPNFVYLGAENQMFFPYNAYSGGSPDGIDEEAKEVYEIKCPENADNHILYCLISTGDELKKERNDYYCQIQFNMMCYARVLGCEFAEMRGRFISYCPIVMDGYKDIHEIEIFPDMEVERKIKDKLEQASIYAKEIINNLKKVNNNE